MGALAAAAGAAALPPTLKGENLSVNLSYTPYPDICVKGFSLSGTATGPYPGTFSEVATYTLVSTAANSAPGDSGNVTAYHVSFTINSSAGTVTGSETLAHKGNPGAAGTYECGTSAGGTWFDLSNVATDYTATITTPDGGIYSDHGTTSANFSDSEGLGGTVEQAALTDAFTATTTAVKVVKAPRPPATTGPPAIGGSPVQGQTQSPPASPPSTLGATTPPPSGTQAAPSAAQIKEQLFRQLVPSRRTARITGLLKRGGYRFSFKALSAGRVRISWYAVRRDSRKSVLVATGRARFSGARLVRITMKLTASGRRMLRTARRLRLTALGTYTSTGRAAAVSATRALTLRR